MKKETWIRPQAMIEEFEPNEYVAICYNVPCSQGANARNSEYGDGTSHWKVAAYGSNCHDHSGSCSIYSNNFITTDKSGNFTGIYEMSSDQGKLAAAFDDWIDSNDNNKYDAGDIVFWHTNSADNKRQWNHWGVLETADSKHPNRS